MDQLLRACKNLFIHLKKDGLGLVKSLFQAVVLMLFINWIAFQLSIIPTGSMKPTVLEGDIVLISKLHYGAKTPQTPLHLPFTQEKIPFFNLRSYLTWVQLPTYSLPGFSKPKRGDCVVIQHPKDASLPGVPLDVQVPYLKRIIGMPGDTLSIINGQVYVNGKRLEPLANYQYAYIIQADQRLPASFFTRHDIKEYERLVTGGVRVYMTAEKAQALSKIASIQKVERVVQKPDEVSKGSSYARFAQEVIGGNNKDHIPPFRIPYKGMEVKINKQTLRFYIDSIKACEEARGRKVEVKDGVLWIEGEKVVRYKFTQNGYLVMGDNRDGSYDSRFFGLVPEIHLLGKAVMIVCSVKNPKTHILSNLLTLNMRWSRTFQRLR